MTTSPYNRPDVVSPEDELRSNYIGLEQIKKQLSTAKLGSVEYKKYKASFDATTARIKELEGKSTAARTTAATQESISKREALVEAVTRATDYGTKAQQNAAQAKLDAFDSPSGKIANDKKTADDKKITDAAAASKAAEADKAAKDKAAADAKTKTGATVPPVPGVKLPATGPGSDPKGIWIDALTQTFKTGIDDPKQKAQIDNLITTAKSQKWNEATFMSALKGTSWWQQTFPTLRQFFLDTHDPRQASTFAQTMVNKVNSVQASMELLGIKVNDIDPVTGKVIDNTATVKQIAAQAMQNGWDDNQIRQHLASKSEIIFTGGGQLGSYVDQIKRQALNYGVSLDKNQLATINNDLLNPQDGKDAQWYLNNIKQQAIDANPAFAAPLKEGRSLYEVTSSYRNQMAQLLEVDPTNITWNDLMNKVMNKDKGVANTFADFTKQVKQDPMWQTTKNAKETYSNMALDLMKQFGFSG